MQHAVPDELPPPDDEEELPPCTPLLLPPVELDAALWAVADDDAEDTADEPDEVDVEDDDDDADEDAEDVADVDDVCAWEADEAAAWLLLDAALDEDTPDVPPPLDEDDTDAAPPPVDDVSPWPGRMHNPFSSHRKPRSQSASAEQ